MRNKGVIGVDRLFVSGVRREIVPRLVVVRAATLAFPVQKLRRKVLCPHWPRAAAANWTTTRKTEGQVVGGGIHLHHHFEYITVCLFRRVAGDCSPASHRGSEARHVPDQPTVTQRVRSDVS